MDVASAINNVLSKYPDRKINGNPGECRGKYVFNMISKDHIDGTPNWDSTMVAIDKNTGEITQFDAFEALDFLSEEKPILSY